MKGAPTKSAFLAAGVACFIASCVATAQQPSLITSAGVVGVRPAGSGYAVTFDDRIVRMVDTIGAYAPRIVDHFENVPGYALVVVFQGARLLDTCIGGSLFTAAFAIDGSVKISNDVWYCGEVVPVVKAVRGRLSITIPGARGHDDKSRGRFTTWDFNRGTLEMRRRR